MHFEADVWGGGGGGERYLYEKLVLGERGTCGVLHCSLIPVGIGCINPSFSSTSQSLAIGRQLAGSAVGFQVKLKVAADANRKKIVVNDSVRLFFFFF